MEGATWIEELVREAFRTVEAPPAWALRGSSEGDEPYRLEEEFKHVPHWSAVDASYLDQAPVGLSTALSFFSDEAFRFYLPGYIIADLHGSLSQTDLVFYLCGPFGERRSKQISPRRYGARTWFDAARHRFSVFDAEQSRAIVAFLLWKRERSDIPIDVAAIDEALGEYWRGRAAAPSHPA